MNTILSPYAAAVLLPAASGWVCGICLSCLWRAVPWLGD